MESSSSAVRSFEVAVPLKGQQRIVAIHSVAVVGDANEFAPAGFHLDADAMGAGIERVLQQFFHHRGWTIDHLAGSDLIRYLV